MGELENIYKFFSKIFSGQKFRGPSKFRRKTHKWKFPKWPKITTWHQKIRFFGRITIQTPNILEKWLNTLKIPSLIYRLWKSAESADLSTLQDMTLQKIWRKVKFRIFSKNWYFLNHSKMIKNDQFWSILSILTTSVKNDNFI